MEEQASLVDRVGAVAVLDEPLRRALFELVTRSDTPVSRDAAAEALAMSRSTAAFHLDKLAAEGLVEVVFARLTGRSGPGAGRPAKLYQRATGELSVSLPERHYDLAAQLLAAAIDAAAVSGEPVGDVLPRLARATGAALGEPGSGLVHALEECGFEPRPDGDGGFLLGNCPFHKLAQRFPALMCGINLELLRGVADGLSEDDGRMVLDPAPGRCCVRVV